MRMFLTALSTVAFGTSAFACSPENFSLEETLLAQVAEVREVVLDYPNPLYVLILDESYSDQYLVLAIEQTVGIGHGDLFGALGSYSSEKTDYPRVCLTQNYSTKQEFLYLLEGGMVFKLNSLKVVSRGRR